MPLTAEGFIALRASDYLDIIRDAYESDTEFTIDWARDVFLGNITANMADRLGDTSEGTQALYDAMSRANATGVPLDNIGIMVGLPREELTFSTATVTLGGTSGTIIIAGREVKGGGVADDAIWLTQSDVTIGGGGTVDVVVQAQEGGEVKAIIGAIDEIVTPVSGWDTVTNAIAATPGDDEELDGPYRLRQEQELAVSGSASAQAIRTVLDNNLDFLDAVIVLENDQLTTIVIDSITLPGKSAALVVLPNPLTADQITQVAKLYYDNLSIGIESVGTVVTTVLGADEVAKTIKFNYATSLNVAVAYTVILGTGVVIGDVDQALIDATLAFGAALNVGDPLRILDLQGVAGGIPGIIGISTLTLNAGTADIIAGFTQTIVMTPDPTVVA